MKIGILSDIHEDIQLLTQALRVLDKERCDRLVSLGDIVGVDYGYYGDARIQDAEECIRLIKENCSVSIAGNHDLFAIKKLPGFPAGFDYPAKWYSIPLKERLRIGKGKIWDYSDSEDQVRLSDRSLSYLSGLPEFFTEEVDGIRILYSHHLHPDFSGSLRKMPTWPPAIWPHLKWMKHHGCQVSLSGHVHLEGTLIGSWWYLRNSSDTRHLLNGNRQWMSCPPITRGGVSSGFMILDTKSNRISVNYFDKSTLS